MKENTQRRVAGFDMGASTKDGVLQAVMVKFSLDDGGNVLAGFPAVLVPQLVTALLGYAQTAFDSNAELDSVSAHAQVLVTSLRPELTTEDVQYPPVGALVGAVQEIHEGTSLRLNLLFGNGLEGSILLDRGRVVVLAGYVMDVFQHFDEQGKLAQSDVRH